MVVLWKEKSAVPTHALHFSYGIGALIVPQAARPFLPKVHESFSSLNFASNTTVTPNTATQNQTGQELHIGEEHKDRIEIIYGILGGISLLFSLIFLIYQLRRTQNNEEDKKEIQMNKQCLKCVSDFKAKFRKSLIVQFSLLFFAFALPVGAERAYGNFLFSFSVESILKMSPESASILKTVFWASFTSGRGIATLASNWAPPHTLIACEIAIKIISAFLLAFLANTNPIILWVMSGVLGATIAPIFPACLVWTNLYIEMNAAMNAFAYLSTALGDFAFSWLTGYLFEYKGPMYLMYLMLAYALVTGCVYLLLYFFFKLVKMPKVDKKDNDVKVDGVVNESIEI